MQNRIKRRKTGPMTGYSAEQGLACPVSKPVRFRLLSFNPVLHPRLKNDPEKSMFRETCLDLKHRNIKPVHQPVFCIQVAEARSPTNILLRQIYISLYLVDFSTGVISDLRKLEEVLNFTEINGDSNDICEIKIKDELLVCIILRNQRMIPRCFLVALIKKH